MKKINSQELKQVLTYSPDIGMFVWNIRDTPQFPHCKYLDRVAFMWNRLYADRIDRYQRTFDGVCCNSF